MRGTRANDCSSAPKQLEKIDGRSMLAVLLDALEGSRVAGVVVVVNPVVVDQIVSERPATERRVYVVNHRLDSEMIESVQMGLSRVGRNRACLICPGDHPWVTREVIDQCVAAFEASCDRLILASHGGRRGHPIILPADLADLVAGWPPTERLDTLRTRFPERVQEIEVRDAGVLMDVDTVADLERVKRLKSLEPQMDADERR